jgi:type IV pilus assembly protein PilM
MAFIFRKFQNTFQALPRGFGLDISDRSLKFVYLEQSTVGYSVKAFGERAFEKGIVEKGKILAPDQLAVELHAAIVDSKHELPRYALLALPEEEVFLRVIQVPHMNMQELREAIRWETEANIPLSIEDVYYDYQILDETEASKKLKHFDVMVAAVPKVVADGYFQTLAKAKIMPLVIEPESASIARSLVPNTQGSEPIFLVDIGVVRTRFVVYAAGAVRFTSFVTLSVESFLQALQAVMHIDSQEAQRILFSTGINRATRQGQIFDALVAVVTDLKEQMEKYMQFYLTQEEHEHKEKSPFSSVLLAGGGSLIPGLVDYLSSELKAPVSIGHPWTNIIGPALQEIPEIPYRESIRYAAVLGLALRGAKPVKNLRDNTFYAA